ncbi:hypothetical protein AC249_AIPGENE26552 [Exaiptasia diaphana]|nr:hypothetical protein AC249_AIPGENE26552 [Exaiptasia diaphana]
MAATTVAGKDEVKKQVLVEFEGIKRRYDITGDMSKSDLLNAVFKTRHPEERLSLQRFDSEWEEYVDVESCEIKDHDKIKFIILNKESQKYHDSNCSETQIVNSQEGSISAAAVNHLITNLEDERSSLEFRMNMAKATVSSLKEVPRPRPLLGRNKGFTCSNCHYKGHRMSTCQQPTCQGYFECGQLTLHKEHRDLLKEAESEVKKVQSLIKKKDEEIQNHKFLKDLRTLSAACSHKVPPDTTDLEKVIEDYQKKVGQVKSFSEIKENFAFNNDSQHVLRPPYPNEYQIENPNRWRWETDHRPFPNMDNRPYPNTTNRPFPNTTNRPYMYPNTANRPYPNTANRPVHNTARWSPTYKASESPLSNWKSNNWQEKLKEIFDMMLIIILNRHQLAM